MILYEPSREKIKIKDFDNSSLLYILNKFGFLKTTNEERRTNNQTKK